MNTMIWKKLTAIFALSVLVCVAFIVVTNLMPTLPAFAEVEGATLTTHLIAAHPTPQEAQGGGADMLAATGQTLVLGEDATVTFLVAPCGARMTGHALPTNTMVEMVGKRMACGHLWYLVQQTDGTSGWLACGLLATPDAPCLAESRFCNEALCGNTLSLESEELWFFANLNGVSEGDMVQYVLTVNNERYQQPPVEWTEQARGQQMIQLLDYAPRMEPGRWNVQLFVNGEFVGEAEVNIQRPTLVGRPEA
ncbi:MAG: hypothetical protein H0T73_22350 [Ardenticatenales bacterium]|nr:hypothetical protein [Ardenticatenales bacterium]